VDLNWRAVTTPTFLTWKLPSYAATVRAPTRHCRLQERHPASSR